MKISRCAILEKSNKSAPLTKICNLILSNSYLSGNNIVTKRRGQHLFICLLFYFFPIYLYISIVTDDKTAYILNFFPFRLSNINGVLTSTAP